MQPRSPKILEDIRDAATFVRAVTATETLATYGTNRLLRQAVERNFEIIGEAMRRLDHHDPETARRVPNYARVIAFRNILIHGYDLIDHVLVWDTIHQHLPALQSAIEMLLAEAE